MVQDRAILTTADQQQVIYKCPIFNDLERPDPYTRFQGQ